MQRVRLPSSLCVLSCHSAVASRTSSPRTRRCFSTRSRLELRPSDGGPPDCGVVSAAGRDAPRLTQHPAKHSRVEKMWSSARMACGAVELRDGGEVSPPSAHERGRTPSALWDHEESVLIARDSALYSNYTARGQLRSRARMNSWEVLRRRYSPTPQRSDANPDSLENIQHSKDRTSTVRGDEQARNETERPRDDTSTVRADATPRTRSEPTHPHDPPSEWREHEAADHDDAAAVWKPVAFHDARRQHRTTGHPAYSPELVNEMLTDITAMKGESRSTYGLRKIPLSGVSGYTEVISAAEEVQLNEELLQALQDPTCASYITTETRYCVNLYERQLGMAVGSPNERGSATLALCLDDAAPTLKRVLHRFYGLGLIPSLPNVCQVSEMIGNFAGYPVHSSPPALGSYYGLLNLISPTVLHLQHQSCPWYPRLYLSPRSLTVVSEPSFSDFKMGYKQLHQPFHTFEYATRLSKDYRVEVLFATVEVQHLSHLWESIQLTDYATQKRHRKSLPHATSPASPDPQQHPPPSSDHPAALQRTASEHVRTTDAWIQRLKAQLFPPSPSSFAPASPPSFSLSDAARPAFDGLQLRQEALQQGFQGTPISITTPTSASGAVPSPTQKRLQALKARHDFASRPPPQGRLTRSARQHTPHVLVGPPK